MKTLKQLYRQPVKTISGILLVALAVAVLVVCLCQSLAAKKTEAELEYKFTTIALTTGNYNFKDSTMENTVVRLSYMNKDVAAWIEAQIEANPELVETISRSGLASAYIPALTLDNHSANGYQEYYEGKGSTIVFDVNTMTPGGGKYAPSYSNAMFLITMKEVGEPTQYPTIITTATGETVTREGLTGAMLTGRIDQVIGLEAGYEDPTGQTIKLSFWLDTPEAYEALELTVGQQYLVYGTHYYWRPIAVQQYVEQAWEAMTRNFPERAEEFRDFDEGKLYYLTEEEQRLFAENNPGCEIVPIALYGDPSLITEGFAWNNGYAASVRRTELPGRVYYSDKAVLLTEENFARISIPAMTLRDQTVYVEYNWEDASVDETREIIENGETVTISWDEYKERYGVSTIAKLEGSVEDFLAANDDWQQALHNIEINYHTFPIIGVEKLSYIADFARGLARVTEGRDFTKEELESGAKLCIISEQLAQINGLQVGDTIDPQFYNYDYNIPQQTYLSKGSNTVMPSAYYYSEAHTEFDGDPVEYTIIGLYRQDDAWGDARENIYAFAPNTIFVPQTSVTSDMDYAEQGVFRTIILKNGCIDEFEAIMSQHEFEPLLGVESMRDLFVYYDQGYSQVKESFYGYQELSRKVILVGVAVYAIVLLLFLILYPARQGKILRTMGSLGAGWKEKIGYVLGSSSAILLPGTLLGAALTLVLWGPVVSRLLTAGGASFSLSLDLGTLAAVAAAQLAVALLLVLLIALPMTWNKNLMKRK